MPNTLALICSVLLSCLVCPCSMPWVPLLEVNYNPNWKVPTINRSIFLPWLHLSPITDFGPITHFVGLTTTPLTAVVWSWVRADVCPVAYKLNIRFAIPCICSWVFVLSHGSQGIQNWCLNEAYHSSGLQLRSVLDSPVAYGISLLSFTWHICLEIHISMK